MPKVGGEKKKKVGKKYIYIKLYITMDYVKKKKKKAKISNNI